MGHASNKPEYTGLQKYPGILATVITIIIGGVFIGALWMGASHGEHGDDGGHGAATESSH